MRHFHPKQALACAHISASVPLVPFPGLEAMQGMARTINGCTTCVKYSLPIVIPVPSPAHLHGPQAVDEVLHVGKD